MGLLSLSGKKVIYNNVQVRADYLSVPDPHSCEYEINELLINVTISGKCSKFHSRDAAASFFFSSTDVLIIRIPSPSSSQQIIPDTKFSARPCIPRTGRQELL